MLTCSAVFDSLRLHELYPARLLCPWDFFPGKNTGVGCHFLLQGIFLTHRLKLCLPHWQEDSLPLVPPGKPHSIYSSLHLVYISVQFSSFAQSCLTLCDPMNCSMPGFSVHHQCLEFTQTHVHRVGDAIQPSHPLSSFSPPAPNPSQHQGLFQ